MVAAAAVRRRRRRPQQWVPYMTEFVASFITIHGYPNLEFSNMHALLDPPPKLIILPIYNFQTVPIHDVVVLSTVF